MVKKYTRPLDERPERTAAGVAGGGAGDTETWDVAAEGRKEQESSKTGRGRGGRRRGAAAHGQAEPGAGRPEAGEKGRAEALRPRAPLGGRAGRRAPRLPGPQAAEVGATGRAGGPPPRRDPRQPRSELHDTALRLVRVGLFETQSLSGPVFFQVHELLAVDGSPSLPAKTGHGFGIGRAPGRATCPAPESQRPKSLVGAEWVGPHGHQSPSYPCPPTSARAAPAARITHPSHLLSALLAFSAPDDRLLQAGSPISPHPWSHAPTAPMFTWCPPPRRGHG